MLIGFALKTDVAVGAHHVSVAHEQNAPLDQIPHIEADEEQLNHLCGMDALVVEGYVGEIAAVTHEDEAEEVDGQKSWRRQDAVVDNHGRCEIDFAKIRFFSGMAEIFRYFSLFTFPFYIFVVYLQLVSIQSIINT